MKQPKTLRNGDVMHCFRCQSEHATLMPMVLSSRDPVYVCANVNMCNERMRAKGVTDEFTGNQPPARRRTRRTTAAPRKSPKHAKRGPANRARRPNLLRK